MGDPIYVEITINAPLERLWTLTQVPQEHERWDLRFTTIDYLPRPSEAEPQRFTYQTRIGLGLKIGGTGESTGTREVNGERSSSLWFGSDDPKSLIVEGSGYWKYIPSQDGMSVRFLTLYDYRTRYGVVGRVFDTLVFRPLIGWATAWSFDRLRLWLQKGIDPTLSALRALVDAIARFSLALCWAYQGLVPKILTTQERDLWRNAEALPVFIRDHATLGASMAGAIELLIACCYLIGLSRRWPYLLGLLVLAPISVAALFVSPDLFIRPFNPASLVAAMAGLSVCGLAACRDLPSARRCLRRKPKGVK